MFENLLRAVRRFGSGRFGAASTRRRQPRLAYSSTLASLQAGKLSSSGVTMSSTC